MSLNGKIKDPKLIKKLESVREYSKDNLLRFWQIHAPHFVDHGETHCLNIESLLSRFIPEPVIEKMTEHEIFLLLCGVWLHDIGMTAKTPGESDKDVRDKHHKKSRELIRKALPQIQLTDDERYIVGEIAFFHRKAEDISNAVEVYETQLGTTLSKIRVRFLCASLRLADGCDIAHSRSSRIILEINEFGEEAKFHHEAHLHVSAVDFDDISHEILITARVQNATDALLLENFLKSDLEKELLSVKDVLVKYSVDYASVKPIITIDSFAEAMPHLITKPTSMSLDDRLVEIEKRTGYYPNMTIDSGSTIHVFYETISQTAKELQNEALSVIGVVCDLFFDKQKVIITLNKIHDLSRTRAFVEPEIITIVIDMTDYEIFKIKNNKAEFWQKLHFFRRAINDKFLNKKAQINWRLIP